MLPVQLLARAPRLEPALGLGGNGLKLLAWVLLLAGLQPDLVWMPVIWKKPASL